jgi:hypothetical protein
MLKLTLDTNCIIDLEEDRPDAVFVREIVQAWKDGKIDLAVVAVTASENQSSGAVSETYADFEMKIEKVGLGGVEQLLPMMLWDVFYWDHALWADEEMDALATAIQRVLFPNMDLDPPENIDRNSSWRNKQCDVLTAWSHAFHKWDYLVTRDTNFHKRKEALRSIGVAEIIHPKDAVLLCRA